MVIICIAILKRSMSAFCMVTTVPAQNRTALCMANYVDDKYQDTSYTKQAPFLRKAMGLASRQAGPRTGYEKPTTKMPRCSSFCAISLASAASNSMMGTMGWLPGFSSKPACRAQRATGTLLVTQRLLQQG